MSASQQLIMPSDRMVTKPWFGSMPVKPEFQPYPQRDVFFSRGGGVPPQNQPNSMFNMGGSVKKKR